MTYIYGIIVIGVFFAALNYFTDLSHSQKWWVITAVLSILSIAVMFNEYSDSQSKKTLNIAMQFNQNKTVICQGLEINNTNYTLSTGTYTFIGKQNTPNYGQMLSVSDCK